MSYYAVSCCTILTKHQFNYTVNHSVTVCFHKQLLFTNSYCVPLPLSSSNVCWHSKIGKDIFFKLLSRFWWIFTQKQHCNSLNVAQHMR